MGGEGVSVEGDVLKSKNRLNFLEIEEVSGAAKSAETPNGVGLRLAQAREGAGYSITDVAGYLRVRKNYLEAIEAERYDALPGRTYAIGFVRAFARTDCAVDALAARLSKDWAILRVTFKPFPVCAFNQTPVTAALEMKQEIAGRTIKSVTVTMNPYETGYAGMDSAGPFNSISGTLMSIPFCIAATLERGTPTMRMMTTYDDATVNALVERVTLVSDEAVPTLCCRIAVALEDGAVIERYESKTTDDFAYDRATDSALIRRVGAETDIPSAVYDRLEAFVWGLPDGDIGEVLRCFAALPGLRKAA